eukprot:6407340-Prymnesium_polylepis.1
MSYDSTTVRQYDSTTASDSSDSIVRQHRQHRQRRIIVIVGCSPRRSPSSRTRLAAAVAHRGPARNGHCASMSSQQRLVAT